MPGNQPPGSPGNPSNQTINVYVTNPSYVPNAGPDSTFAWMTLLAYFVCTPLGAILNVIGLITGPSRGCFFAMFLLLFIPWTLAIVAMIVAIAFGALENADLQEFFQKIK